MFVVGTAGHVDHGKSTLVHALTGIDPDRLAEEKARGLTIDLGFAWMTLPSQREIAIVDVPGHERFVPNMLAGAGAVDAVVFVVDANEGWRAQSEEHRAIVELLGVRAGVVALTKSDVARDVDQAAAAVRDRLQGTALAAAPIVAVSARTGAGLAELARTLDEVLDALPQERDRGRCRLYVDRAFSIKGAGTVVTGTLTGGRLAAGQDVEIAPSGRRARVRSIQVHQRSVDEAAPVSRVALNLAGVSRDEVRRGDAVVVPGEWEQSATLDVQIEAVRGPAGRVTSRGAYLFYLGTAEIPARVRLLDATALAESQRAFARISLASPVVAQPGDRFALRDASRATTVGGGRVLDAHPMIARLGPEKKAVRVEQLRRRASAASSDLADLTVDERGVVEASQLRRRAGVPHGSISIGPYVASPQWLNDAQRRILAALQKFHAAKPLRPAMPREGLRAAAGFADARLFAEVVTSLGDAVVERDAGIRLSAHEVVLTPQQTAARRELLDAAGAGFTPPDAKELAARFGRPLLDALVGAGDLVPVGGGIVMTPQRLAEARQRIAAAIGTEGPVTASRVRQLLGSTRKYVIPLLELLDDEGFTRRDGDRRSLGDEPARG